MTKASASTAVVAASLLLVLLAGCPVQEELPPTHADFSADPVVGTHPLTVAFENLSTGDYSSLCWDFGDGCESLYSDPRHAYQNPGVFTVTLTLYDAEGGILDARTRQNLITVNHGGPVAQFHAAPTVAHPGDVISFTDESLGLVDTWSWDFGDGATSADPHPVHDYASPGIYTVALTVSGSGGEDTLVLADYITVYPLGTPIPDFTASPVSVTTGALVNFTDLSSGTVTSWSWDFGDGGTSTAQHPVHTYSASGLYTVALTATGPSGSNTETKIDFITVSDPAVPVADFSASSTLVYLGNGVAFTDLSTGSVTGWSWTFGDGGTSAIQHPSHTYAATGRYTVTLTVTGPGGSDVEAKLNYVTVVQAGGPQAAFSGTPTSVAVGSPVAFTDASTGLVDTWSWSFGDGSTSSQQHPSHAYSAAGYYTVTLTVSGPNGSDTETKVNYITAGQPAPVASFYGTPQYGASPLTVTFTDTSTGAVTSWSWNFGDGSTSTAQHPTHTYTFSPGTYFTVSLTATGPGGSHTCTKTNYIGSNPIPTPPPKPVIYLYRPRPAFDTVTVKIDGTATVTIPEIPLGPVITWENVWIEDGRITYQGETYPYLFYESETWRPIHAHRGWILSRDAAGNLFLDGEPITFEGVKNHFVRELEKAGFYANEIDDFTDFWFGPDALAFFGLDTFTLAVKYFPLDQLEALHEIVTDREYKSQVRVSYLVEFAEPGTTLQKPVYPVPQPGNTAMHEWA